MPNQEKLFPKVIGDVPYPIELMTGAAELELLSLFFFKLVQQWSQRSL